MGYMIARLDDAWLRKKNGEFTNNLLEAESFDSFEEALNYINENTTIISIEPKNIM